MNAQNIGDLWAFMRLDFIKNYICKSYCFSLDNIYNGIHEFTYLLCRKLCKVKGKREGNMMKSKIIAKLAQRLFLLMAIIGVLCGSSMTARAAELPEDITSEEVIEEVTNVVEETKIAEEVSELEAVEVEETLEATEAIGGTWGTVDWSVSNGVLAFEVTDGKTYGAIDEPDSAGSNYSTESVREMVAADYPWAAYKDSITKIVIGGNISAIGDVAFYNMTKVEEITLGSYIYYIRDYVFGNCTSLKKITLPAKLSSMGTGAFYNCTSLTEVTGNIILSEYIFYGCSSLKTIALPAKTIPAYAFYGCSGLTEITIPEGIYICEYAFAKCTGLTSLTIPSGVSFLTREGAFSGCTGLKEVTIESEGVGNYTFKDCTSLVKVNFPEDQTCEVKTGSFYNCTSLSEITGMGSNYQYSFYNCKSLTSCDNLIDGADKIQNYAFYGCTSLKEVTISGQSSINYRAFQGCTGLTKVVFNGDTPYIYGEAFADCGLKEVWFDEESDGYVYYKEDVLKGNSDCKVYGKYDTAEERLAFDNNCTFVPTDKLPQTTMSTLSSALNGIRVTWAEGEYALKYDVYRSTLVGGNYTLLKSGVSGTEYIDTTVTPGVKYYYKVIAVGELAKSELSEASVAGIYLKAPTFKKMVNVVSGVHVYWNATDGAKTYSVYRSTDKTGGYTLVKSGLTATHYIDTTVSSGKTYYYKVLAVNGSYSTSSYVEPFNAITYVGTPDITSRINKAAGIQLGWDEIAGATGYAIYRKPYSGGAWARVATITGNSTFTWTDTTVQANNGTVYKYTIRALAGSDMKTLSGCRNTGRTMVRLSSRTLNSAVKASATSIKCNWTTSSAVTGYEVRFMVGSTVYRTFTVGNYKTGVKTFTGLAAGNTYKIQVRAYKKVDGVGTFYSAWSTAKTVSL